MISKGTNTELEHYTVLAGGTVGELTDRFSCKPGKAVMAIKVWSYSLDEAGEMAKSISNQIGFKVQGKVEIYKTDPKEEAGGNPHGYDIMFTPHH